MTWINWSKTVECTPKNYIKATTIEEVQTFVKQAAEDNRKIRVVASGHSFTRVCETYDTMLDISNMKGIVDVDKDKKQITFWAGTTVNEAGVLCVENGMAQENIGDFDQQTLAGAISTGTHGSGTELTGMAKQIVAFWVVTANGDLLECSKEKNTEIFEAGRVAIGLFGVIVKVKLQLVDAYKLKCEIEKVKINELLPQIPQLLAENRNLEFFYIPMTEYAQLKKMNITNEKVKDSKFKNYVNQYLIENVVLDTICKIATKFKIKAKKINDLMAFFLGDESRVNYYNKVLASVRLVRFKEMEFNLPAEHFEAFFLEIQQLFKENDYNVFFPIEIRWVKEDDIWLSPTYKRDAVYFAVHTYHSCHVPEYFDAVQEIAKKYHGRPHWGKMHSLGAEYFAKVYPKWNDFMDLREKLDPKNLFLNPYMEEIITS